MGAYFFAGGDIAGIPRMSAPFASNRVRGPGRNVGHCAPLYASTDHAPHDLGNVGLGVDQELGGRDYALTGCESTQDFHVVTTRSSELDCLRVELAVTETDEDQCALSCLYDSGTGHCERGPRRAVENYRGVHAGLETAVRVRNSDSRRHGSGRLA